MGQAGIDRDEGYRNIGGGLFVAIRHSEKSPRQYGWRGKSSGGINRWNVSDVSDSSASDRRAHDAKLNVRIQPWLTMASAQVPSGRPQIIRR
jgi:hypothetical protein